MQDKLVDVTDRMEYIYVNMGAIIYLLIGHFVDRALYGTMILYMKKLDLLEKKKMKKRGSVTILSCKAKVRRREERKQNVHEN